MYFKKTLISLAVASSLVLTGCGDSGSDSSSGVTNDLVYQGQVADGYLVNALVCADLNNNGYCDDFEPDGRTDAQGRYSLVVDINQYGKPSRIIVKALKGVTVDADTGQTVQQDFRLIAPSEGSKFISPYSSMVMDEMGKRGISYQQALESVATKIGLSASEADLLEKNFIEPDENDSARLQKLDEIRKIAVATTTLLKKRITEYSALNPLTSEKNLVEVSKASMEDVLSQVQAISQQVQQSNYGIADLHDENNALLSSLTFGAVKKVVTDDSSSNQVGNGGGSTTGSSSGISGTFMSSCLVDSTQNTASARVYEFTNTGSIKLKIATFGLSPTAISDCQNGDLNKAYTVINIPYNPTVTYSLDSSGALQSMNGTVMTSTINLGVPSIPSSTGYARVALVNNGQMLCFGQGEGYYENQPVGGYPSNISTDYANFSSIAIEKNKSDVPSSVYVSTYDHCLKKVQ